MSDDLIKLLTPRRCHKCDGGMRPSLKMVVAPAFAFMRYTCVECRKHVHIPETLTAAVIVLAGVCAVASMEPWFVTGGGLAIVAPLYAYRRNPMMNTEADEPPKAVGDAPPILREPRRRDLP